MDNKEENGRFVGHPRTLWQIVEHLDTRLDKLENRVNYLFGALAVLSVLGNFFFPALSRFLGWTP